MNNNDRIILRMLRNIKRGGGSLRKLHKYFGIQDTERNIRGISIRPDSEYVNIIYLKIKSKSRDYDVLETYIDGLPRDINNVIYSYLFTVRELNYMIRLPINYPFEEPKWVFKKYSENGKSVPHYEPDPNALYCGQDHSPSMHIDLEILLYVSSLSWFNKE
uniref:Uncharacterized protein n=1 Tax=viral metagenome TaxID=1070528 RepID=A0A6C0B3R8_9ZZZZ